MTSTELVDAEVDRRFANDIDAQFTDDSMENLEEVLDAMFNQHPGPLGLGFFRVSLLTHDLPHHRDLRPVRWLRFGYGCETTTYTDLSDALERLHVIQSHTTIPMSAMMVMITPYSSVISVYSHFPPSLLPRTLAPGLLLSI